MNPWIGQHKTSEITHKDVNGTLTEFEFLKGYLDQRI